MYIVTKIEFQKGGVSLIDCCVGEAGGDREVSILNNENMVKITSRILKLGEKQQLHNNVFERSLSGNYDFLAK